MSNINYTQESILTLNGIQPPTLNVTANQNNLHIVGETNLIAYVTYAQQGPAGSNGTDASVIQQTYVWYQSNAATVWTINHNLNRYPSVTVVDSASTKVNGTTKYINSNTITVTFSYAFSGEAYLN